MKEQQSLIQTQQWPHYWGATPEQDYYTTQGIKSSNSFFTSPRGLKLFTRQWLPLLSPPRGLIFMVHGYGNDISWTFQATPIFLAQHGFACFALDLESHGRSDGLKAFVPNVDLVVQDCRFFFNFVKQSPEYQTLPSFLYGESMGGAISAFSSKGWAGRRRRRLAWGERRRGGRAGRGRAAWAGGARRDADGMERGALLGFEKRGSRDRWPGAWKRGREGSSSVENDATAPGLCGKGLHGKEAVVPGCFWQRER